MKIYQLTFKSKALDDYTMLTACEKTVLQFEEYCKTNKIDHKIAVCDVKTQGKNYSEIALPQKYILPF